ncbi:MAG: acyl-CoA thioesterase [Simplicispira suum]|uniref:acyl-CoA thioesterase n=1 Tax=Simplicispira suum TaxID=2109915 RepID=UPI001C6BF827|nr:hotdog domain-containing protein [Simplicispira suum]MBW7834345.1 acyl-CoA thioesterase [Simplicispira suum]
MHSITLRFLAPRNTSHTGARISGGSVLGWVDEAGFACASAWARGDCVTAFVGNAHFLRPVHAGDLVEVRAHLAFTGETSMSLAIEVHTGALASTELHMVLHCAAVYVALDAAGAPRAVDRFSPETPGDMALAQRVQAQIAAAQAVQ